MPNWNFQERLLESVPHLRAYARMLTRNIDRADDLVQETLLSAWEHRKALRDNTKLRPWLLTILNNAYFKSLRNSRREISDSDGKHSGRNAVAPTQMLSTFVQDVATALDKLPQDHREAIILICIQQLSYDEAALVAGCPVGTLKSRLSRGREKLLSLLQCDDREVDFGDEVMTAALSGALHAGSPVT